MDSVVAAVRDVLLGVAHDGSVPRGLSARLRTAVTESGAGRIRAATTEIVNALPAFDTLPAATRKALHAGVLADDTWSMRFRRASWRQALTRAVRTLGLRFSRFRRIQRTLELSEFVFLYWQARLATILYRRLLEWRGRHGREPSLAAALAYAGLDARVLASSYLLGTPQPTETAAYWHDPARMTTVGVVIGIDFIVNDEGVWFVESNLNVGLMEERSRLYDVDPFVTNLLTFARQHGYSSLVFLACNDLSVDDVMAERIERMAPSAGLRATVLEDPYAPRRQWPQRFLVPSLDRDGLLVVRSKMFHTSLDAIFHHKVASLQAIERYQQRFPDHGVRLPPGGVGSFPDTLAMEGAFPNLVCKFPERDQGQGVVFMKAPSIARARAILDDVVSMNNHSVANVWTKLRHRLRLEDQTAIFQAYIPSSLLDGRRLSIARAQVFASPTGIEFLSAHRVVSNRAVPESLAEGIVEDAKPYIVNYSLDSTHAPMPAEEEARVRQAALSVVRALCWAVESRFETGPDDPARGQTRREMPA
jgi:hypothetical protein